MDGVDPIKTLFDSWAEGEPGWGPLRPEHHLASEGELADFEQQFQVTLPQLARSFYQRLNGMTKGEWHRDLNHPNVKFMPLDSLFIIAPPFVMPAQTPYSDEKFIAIAAESDCFSASGNSCLVYGVRLSGKTTLPGEVFGFTEDAAPFFISATFADFLLVCAHHAMWDEDGILNPAWGGALKAERMKYESNKAARSQKIWWKFWT